MPDAQPPTPSPDAPSTRIGPAPPEVGDATDAPLTLAIDIGGTGLKALVLDAHGRPVGDRARVPTTIPRSPGALVEDLAELVGPLPRADRISVGFPGVVHRGIVRTAPVFTTTAGLGTPVIEDLVDEWRGFGLAAAVSDRLGAPCRAANDADVQGAGAIAGEGLEMVLTLGTGVGSAAFRDGALALHLELAHHPITGKHTYNTYLGDAARKRIGKRRWNERLAKAVAMVDTLVCPDAILLGGGNATRVEVDLPDHVRLIDNAAGLLGGIRLWESAGFE